MNEHIPHLNIETLENGNLRLENESMGDSYCVDIHPIHLRMMAERLGLVREMSASEADALRTVDKLARRLRVLQSRIEQLQRWLADAPDMENADINTEYWFNDATLDLANEFLREIDESRAVVTPRPASVPRDTAGPKPSGNPAKTQRVSTPNQHELNV